MWKMFVIGTVCILLICGQSVKYVHCQGQTTSHINTRAYGQQRNGAPAYAPEQYYDSSTVTAQAYYPRDANTESSQAYYPAASNRSAHRQPAAALPPSPVQFPDAIYNTKLPTETFSVRLFELLSDATKNQNLLFSPISLQTLLTFIFTLSEGKLAQELGYLLELPENRSYVAQQFQLLLKTPHNSNENNTLLMANKLYYEKRLGTVRQNVRNLAYNGFASDVEPLDFFNPRESAETINSWIAEKTRYLIQNIISSDSLQPDTRALLINSLYFKSEWQQKFSAQDTEKYPFFLNQQQQVSVDMMYIEDVFPYGEFDELRAKVLELPYKLDDFRMMIILPNEINDLSNVEKRFAKISLKSIADKLQNTEVTVRLPQFKINFEADLVPTLQQLGLFSLFNDEARITLFKDQHKPLRVDQVKQKTFISVNEAGTEAAAITFAKFVPLSIPLRMKQFTVDHPFMFVIRNSKAAYFMGHVTNL